jgi:hypothetical protein
MWYTSQLSISKEEGLRCDEVVQALRDGGIRCSVTPNTSVQCDPQRGCWVEQGCRIVHSIQTKSELAHTWRVLRLRFDLGCAHLTIPAVFSGCVRDFLRPSLCYGNSTESVEP